jgi:predicted RNA-binding Zn-ribbon protein involved in translation (DUF1610 family)
MGSGSYFGGTTPWFTEQPGIRTPIHIGHSQHLCVMAESGDITLEQMKDLVRNPKFICNRCGRVAKSSDNLCEPVSLDYTCGMCGESFSSKAKLMDHSKTHKE